MSDVKRPPTEDPPLAQPAGGEEPRREPGATGEVDLFKVRRVTIPPGMRSKMIDWWAHERHKSVPEDTLPPNQDSPRVPRPDEPTIHVNNGVGDETIPDMKRAARIPNSVTPVGLPSVPLRSTRGIAAAVIFVLAMFTLFVVVRRLGRPAPQERLSAAPSTPASPALTAQVAPAVVPTPAAVAPRAEPSSTADITADITREAAPSATAQPTQEHPLSSASTPAPTAKPLAPFNAKRVRPAPEQNLPTPAAPVKARSGPDTESPPFSD